MNSACGRALPEDNRCKHCTPNAELTGGKAVRSDDLLAQFGPRLTPEEVAECIALSGEPCCQACGREWKDHHERCEGSANARLDPFDDRDEEEDDDREPRDEYMDDEYCRDCGTPSHAIDNGLCPMCFELTGGMGHERR